MSLPGRMFDEGIRAVTMYRNLPVLRYRFAQSPRNDMKITSLTEVPFVGSYKNTILYMCDVRTGMMSSILKGRMCLV